MNTVEMFELWKKEFKHKERMFVAGILTASKGLTIHRCDSYNSISDWRIDDAILSTDCRLLYKTAKITKLDLDELATYVTNYEPSEDKVMFMCTLINTTNTGTTTTGYKLKDVWDDLNHPNLSFDIDKVVMYRRILEEKYAPKDGHSACDYCRKQVPTQTMIKRHIFSRPREYDGLFCDGACAAYAQMGSEG